MFEHKKSQFSLRKVIWAFSLSFGTNNDWCNGFCFLVSCYVCFTVVFPFHTYFDLMYSRRVLQKQPLYLHKVVVTYVCTLPSQTSLVGFHCICCCCICLVFYAWCSYLFLGQWNVNANLGFLGDKTTLLWKCGSLFPFFGGKKKLWTLFVDSCLVYFRFLVIFICRLLYAIWCTKPCPKLFSVGLLSWRMPFTVIFTLIWFLI